MDCRFKNGCPSRSGRCKAAISDYSKCIPFINNAVEAEKQNAAALRQRLTEKDIELRSIRNAANQYKQWLKQAEAERDEALEELNGFCWACANGKPSQIGLGSLTTCDFIRERNIMAQGGHCECKHWQWRGPQKEVGGNDK